MTTGPSRECSTLVLVTLAALTLVVARLESTQAVIWLLASSVFYLAGPWLIHGLQRAGVSAARRLESWLAPLLVAWALLPLGCEFALRKFGIGESLELMMLVSLQNAALMNAAFSQRKKCQQIACLLGAFLVLFAFVIGTSTAVYLLSGLFGVSMLWWLMARYWERVQRMVIVGQTERCLPLRSSVLGGVALLALGVTLLGTTDASTYVLRGFMPSSGGNRYSDDFARAGVGDGDQTVAAQEDAMSFGPVESELFLESDMPTLYDMFNDMYGDPIKPKMKQQRNIGLASEKFKPNHQQLAKTQRSGREFSTVRRKVERRRETLRDRTDAAMLYVVGRVPLHLAMERFDSFDGHDWHHSGKNHPRPPIQCRKENDKPWAYCARIGELKIHRELEPHAVKIINLKTDRFPSPPQLCAVHIDRVDQSDFFDWTDDGVMHMPVRDSIPKLTVVRLRSQLVNLEPLRESDGWTQGLPNRTSQMSNDRTAVDVLADIVSIHTEVPESCQRIAQVADEWTRNVPRGWLQVEAIVKRLRNDFQLDPEAVAPKNCADVVTHFLDAGKGPDYLFATTAAMLLRELGYPTRLVSGFYAREDRFDRSGEQTAVLTEDVHVWVEVYVSGNTWVAIEPTPGYAAPYESLTWTQRLARIWQSVWQWSRDRWHWLLAGALMLSLGWQTRRIWLDGLFATVSFIAGIHSPRRRVLWTIRLLEWRAWLAGKPRPKTAALSTWYGSFVSSLPAETSNHLHASLRFAEYCLYAPVGRQATAVQHNEVAKVCHAVRRKVRVSCFRQAGDDQGKA